MVCASRVVPPTSATRPTGAIRESITGNRMVATRKSNARANSSPRPITPPCSAPITGNSVASNVLRPSCSDRPSAARCGPDCGLRRPRASRPRRDVDAGGKHWPSPCTMTARTSRSSSAPCTAPEMASIISGRGRFAFPACDVTNRMRSSTRLLMAGCDMIVISVGVCWTSVGRTWHWARGPCATEFERCEGKMPVPHGHPSKTNNRRGHGGRRGRRSEIGGSDWDEGQFRSDYCLGVLCELGGLSFVATENTENTEGELACWLGGRHCYVDGPSVARDRAGSWSAFHAGVDFGF